MSFKFSRFQAVKHRLGGVVDHGFEVADIGGGLLQVLGNGHARGNQQVGQAVHQPGEVDHVREAGLPPLSGVGVDHERAIRARTEVGLVPRQLQRGPAPAITERYL
jgi:hypothetical protein